MTNASRCSAAAAFAPRMRLFCVLPSETSSHFFGGKKVQWSSPETESSAREDYKSSPGASGCKTLASRPILSCGRAARCLP